MNRLSLAFLITLGASSVLAQQPSPPPHTFAPPNLTQAGVRSMASACAMCHGTGGRAVPGSSVVALAGKPRAEILQAMAQFRDAQRPATIMHQIAKGYTDAEVAALADYFSAQR